MQRKMIIFLLHQQMTMQDYLERVFDEIQSQIHFKILKVDALDVEYFRWYILIDYLFIK